MNLAELNGKSDLELITLAKEGVSDAYDILFARYKAFICNIARCYFITGIGDADDLIQEGTLAFFKAVTGYIPEKNNSFPAYASLCVHNRIKDVLRSYKLRNSEALVPITNADTNEEKLTTNLVYSDDPVTSYIRDEFVDDLMRKAKALLSPRQFSVFELYLAGFGYQEIAKRLGMDPKAADNALTTAKSKMKKLYKFEEYK